MCDPPAADPGLDVCDGFAGCWPTRVRKAPSQATDMIVRGVAFPESAEPAYAVVVDLPVAAELKQRLRRTTGVDVRGVRPVEVAGPPRPADSRRRRCVAHRRTRGVRAICSWVTFLDYRDWTTGDRRARCSSRRS